MGNAQSDSGEQVAYQFIKYIPVVGAAYSGVRAAVYQGKGNNLMARSSGIGMAQGVCDTAAWFIPIPGAGPAASMAIKAGSTAAIGALFSAADRGLDYAHDHAIPDSETGEINILHTWPEPIPDLCTIVESQQKLRAIIASSSELQRLLLDHKSTIAELSAKNAKLATANASLLSKIKTLESQKEVLVRVVQQQRYWIYGIVTGAVVLCGSISYYAYMQRQLVIQMQQQLADAQELSHAEVNDDG